MRAAESASPKANLTASSIVTSVLPQSMMKDVTNAGAMSMEDGMIVQMDVSVVPLAKT